MKVVLIDLSCTEGGSRVTERVYNLDGSVRSILATGRWSTCSVSTRTRYSGCPSSTAGRSGIARSVSAVKGIPTQRTLGGRSLPCLGGAPLAQWPVPYRRGSPGWSRPSLFVSARWYVCRRRFCSVLIAGWSSGLLRLPTRHQFSSSSSSLSTSSPCSAARNSSEVAASNRLVLMLFLTRCSAG